ncbi:tumor susceptibility gene 101 protein-like [Crassostrea virginica]
MEQVFKHALNKYKYADIARRDAMDVVRHYKDLRPSQVHYIFPDGTRKDLLCLDGTIPVIYKEKTYNIPVCVWIMDTHPYSPPMVYVKPSSTMVLRPGWNVDSNGKVNLPYLQDWRFPQSDVLGLIQILTIVFGEEPPVFTKSTVNLQSPPLYPGSGLTPNLHRNPNNVQECYLEHFERFLENYGIGFARDACVKNGIDNLEIFLMLEKDDFMNVLGLNLGKTLKCIEAKRKFFDMESSI